MAQLIENLDPERIAANLERIRAEIDAAARHANHRGEDVQILAATKYVPGDQMGKLATAGIALVGENRAQDLAAKVAAHGKLFTWDFIGALQSRRVRQIVPHVRLIHSLASRSALGELERHRELAMPGLEVLIQVNIASEPGKAGISPAELDSYIEDSPVPVAGLMGMPPQASDPEYSRRWFAMLRELAAARGLRHLSMGTTQDYLVAVQEGATIVRIGTRLYE